MKFITFIILIYCSTSIAQTIAVEVEYTQSLAKIKDSSFLKPRLLKDIRFLLTATTQESRFSQIKYMDHDAFASNQRFIYLSGASGVFYKNLESKEKLRHLNDFGGNLIIEYPFNGYKWQITNESKFIGKFKCYKAYFTESIYVEELDKEFSFITYAWFTPEIPIPFGPIGIDGLPGLVLEVISNDGMFYFVADNIKTYNLIDNKKFYIKRPESDKQMTKEEYINESSNKYKNSKHYKKLLEKLEKN